MKYIDSEFEDYLKAFYPEGTIPEQRQQVRQAFVCGIWWLLNELRRNKAIAMEHEFVVQMQSECYEIKDEIVGRFN
jgi:hypothetical protein